MTVERWFSLTATAVGLVVVMSTAQASTIRIDPGAYGSYYADGTKAADGTYSLRPKDGGWVFNDRAGVQTQDLGELADDQYEIVARDANVVIGSFSNINGAACAPSGAIVLTGGTNIAFVTQDIAVTGARDWTPCARMWNVSWSQNGLTRFVLPVGDGWSGWWANVSAPDNRFSFNLATNGDVTIVSQNPNIGITGGHGVIKFPEAIATITFTLSAQPPGMNRWALDWVTGNQDFSVLTQNFNLYPGTYFFATDGNDNNWFGGNTFTIPVDTRNWRTVKTYGDGGSTWHWTISAPPARSQGTKDGETRPDQGGGR